MDDPGMKYPKKPPYIITEDSCITYFHSRSDNAVKAMSIHNIRNNKFEHEKTRYFIYSNVGKLLKIDTTRNAVDLDSMRKKILVKDTLELNNK